MSLIKIKKLQEDYLPNLCRADYKFYLLRLLNTKDTHAVFGKLNQEFSSSSTSSSTGNIREQSSFISSFDINGNSVTPP